MKTRIGIIGGGASGLLLSILLKKKLPNIEVMVFEALDKVGKKLLQTGNGKGNISNINIESICYNHNIDLTLRNFIIIANKNKNFY